MSAEDCTVRRDSLLWWRIAFSLGSEGLIVTEEIIDNGWESAKQPTSRPIKTATAGGGVTAR
jgi:hypothetical protein